MNVSFECFKIANDHTPDSFMVSFISDLQTVSSYLPLQVLLEVFPEMQPELSEDSRKPKRYEEIPGMKRLLIYDLVCGESKNNKNLVR